MLPSVSKNSESQIFVEMEGIEPSSEKIIMTTATGVLRHKAREIASDYCRNAYQTVSIAESAL